MKRNLSMFILLLIVAVLTWLVVPSGPVHGQTGYELTRSSVSAGGVTASGGVYTLSATIGQPDAGEATGGDYVLGGGFWGGGVIPENRAENLVFLPLMIK